MSIRLIVRIVYEYRGYSQQFVQGYKDNVAYVRHILFQVGHLLGLVEVILRSVIVLDRSTAPHRWRIETEIKGLTNFLWSISSPVLADALKRRCCNELENNVELGRIFILSE